MAHSGDCGQRSRISASVSVVLLRASEPSGAASDPPRQACVRCLGYLLYRCYLAPPAAIGLSLVALGLSVATLARGAPGNHALER